MLQGAGPSGFSNAPVTKALVFSLGINTVIVSLLDVRHRFTLQLYPHIFQNHQFWRFVTTQFFFSTTSELLVGTYLLYHLRLLERRWSSNKYASFLFVSALASTVFTTVATVLARGIVASGAKGVGRIPPGPVGVVMAGLCVYLRTVPESYKFSVFGRDWTDHALIYAFAAQLLSAQFPASLTNFAGGLLAALLYEADVLGVRSWRFWSIVQRTASFVFKPFATGTPAQGELLSGTTVEDQRVELQERYQAAARQAGRTGRRSVGREAGFGGTRGRTGGTPAPVVGPPPPEAVELLTGMGFPEARVLQALTQARNDVEAAAAILFGD
ncbi:hypothetical protein HKX48_003483 [Thoreauomyces humboldtii]|nr:hypothetical protein HKX48_003483 [Thoreauomyces humboldtii]